MKTTNTRSWQVGVVGKVLAVLVHGGDDGVEVVVFLAGTRAQSTSRLPVEPDRK